MGCAGGQGFLLSRPLSVNGAATAARRAVAGPDVAFLPTADDGLRETG